MAKGASRRARATSGPAQDFSGAGLLVARESDGIVVGRNKQRRIDITLVHGSILDVTSRAIALGSFRNVDPGGAAKAVDARLGGRLRDLIRSRTVSSEAGTMFVLPTMRSGLRTDMVVFAGLGPFDRFAPEMIELVASNLVRTLVGGNVEEFATVLFGAGSGFEARACTEHLFRGVIGGLRDADPEGRFRGMTICELDKDKFAIIRDEIVRGCLSDFCKDFDVVVRERHLADAEVRVQADSQPSSGRTAATSEAEPMYLLVRTDNDGRRQMTLSVALLTAGGKAAVLEAKCDIQRSELEKVLGSIDSDRFGIPALTELGHSLGKLVLPEAVRVELARSRRRHLVVVHDLASARLPWEALRLGQWVPATAGGLSRRYVAADLAISRWAEHRGRQHELTLLLIVDPTSDLPGAVDEAERIRQLAAADPRVRVTRISQKQVTRDVVLDHLRSEEFDVIHYAGHAFFEPGAPGESGIHCADGVLRALDLLNLRSLPPLLFFNACEAARVRRAPARKRKRKTRPDARQALAKAVGFAEAFMRYGVANFVGTYWPVGDASAATFARAFYALLLSGAPLGDALLAGRKAVQASGSVDWADYIHYGDPRFRIKDHARSTSNPSAL
jgi:CHAT domain/Cytosol aminopeptidase family, N-terminal domain